MWEPLHMPTSGAFLQTIGRLHVATVHFPIALLVVAGLIESWRWVRRGDKPSPAGVFCLVSGTIALLLAAAMGWIHKGFSQFSGPSGTTLLQHQWLGVAAGAAGLVAIMLLVAARSARGLKVYRAAVILVALLVAVTGHLGGSLTHGQGYLTELLWNQTENSPSVSSPIPQPSSLSTSVDFVRDVQPILAQSCYECHGPEKRRGNLRLDNKHAAFDGGNSGPSIVIGKSAESPLIKRVLGQGNQKRMPVDHPPLTQAQTSLLIAWIDQGASWPDSASAKDDEKHWAYVPPSAGEFD